MNNHSAVIENVDDNPFIDPIPMGTGISFNDADVENIVARSTRISFSDTLRRDFRRLLSDEMSSSSEEANKRFETFDDLCTLGIVRSLNVNNGTIYLDVNRLYNIGYVLIYDIEKRIPTFTRCVDLSFLYNLRLYVSDCIYLKSLDSYHLIKIKQNFTSYTDVYVFIF